MGSLVVLIYALPVIGLAVSMAAVGGEFVFNALATRPRPRVEPPPAVRIPRKVDLREGDRVDAWLFRHGLTDRAAGSRPRSPRRLGC